MEPKTARIRALNDELRQNLGHGHAVMTHGVVAHTVARSAKDTGE